MSLGPLSRILSGCAVGLVASSPAIADSPQAYLFAGLPGTYTSNAFLTENGVQQDVFGAPQYGVGVRGSKIKFGSGELSYDVKAFLNDARYNEFGELDGDAAGGAGRLAYTKGAWTIAAAYNPSWNYTSGFNEFTLGLHDLSLAAAYTRRFGKTTIRPGIALARRISTNNLAERFSLGGQVTIAYKIANGLVISVSPNATEQWYDTFPGRDRRDTVFGVSAGLEVEVSKGMTLNLGLTRLIRDSSIKGLDFAVTNLGPKLGLEYKF